MDIALHYIIVFKLTSRHEMYLNFGTGVKERNEAPRKGFLGGGQEVYVEIVYVRFLSLKIIL